MNNNAIGFIVSALLHASLFSGAALLSKEKLNKKALPVNRITLNIQSFKTQTVKPTANHKLLRQVQQTASPDKKAGNIKLETAAKQVDKIEKKVLTPKFIMAQADKAKAQKPEVQKSAVQKKSQKIVETKPQKNRNKTVKTITRNSKPKIVLSKKTSKKLIPARKTIKKKIAKKIRKTRALRHPKKILKQTRSKPVIRPRSRPNRPKVVGNQAKQRAIMPKAKQITRQRAKQKTIRTAIRTVPKRHVSNTPRQYRPRQNKPSQSKRSYYNDNRNRTRNGNRNYNKNKPVKSAQRSIKRNTAFNSSRPASKPNARHARQQPRQNTYSPHRNAPVHYVKPKPKSVAETAATRQLSKQYKARLQQLIVANKHYPKRARRHRQQGRVTVAFRVIHSGIISNIKIIKSSNYATLDNAALQAIKRSSAKLPFFAGMPKKSLNLRITINYIIK